MVAEKQPSGKFSKPEDLGELAAFLVSDNARQVNGASWTMDGGWTAQWSHHLKIISLFNRIIYLNSYFLLFFSCCLDLHSPSMPTSEYHLFMKFTLLVFQFYCVRFGHFFFKFPKLTPSVSWFWDRSLSWFNLLRFCLCFLLDFFHILLILPIYFYQFIFLPRYMNYTWCLFLKVIYIS